MQSMRAVVATSRGGPEVLRLENVPLGWRRQAPLASALSVIAGLTIASFAWELADQTIFPTIAVAITTYSVAAYCGRTAAVAGGALTLVSILVHQLARQQEYGDAVFIVAMLAAVWLAGRLVRRHPAQHNVGATGVCFRIVNTARTAAAR